MVSRGLIGMDQIELAFALSLVFILGVAWGYALRAAISARRRQKAYRLRHARGSRTEVEAARATDLSRYEAPRLTTD